MVHFGASSTYPLSPDLYFDLGESLVICLQTLHQIGIWARRSLQSAGPRINRKNDVAPSVIRRDFRDLWIIVLSSAMAST
jgi:hypothetical protein